MRIASTFLIVVAGLVVGCAASPPQSDRGTLQRQVADTERAFARTMAARDHAAFKSFLSAEAVFLSEPRTFRGRDEVAAAWKRYYEQPQAPFSWEPARVEVLDSGTLALSTGPVRDANGREFATFTSIWRLEAPGVWRIVFDKGDDTCDCPRR